METSQTHTITKLDSSVINRIAAGEIIIQPANALKELIENSIDAGSTSVDILVKDGGIKLLQITDNGHGIHKEDLGLLCERFATSKLAKFEDLESISTYGFRGEALASISHIARLSVVTKTKGSDLAYKAFYLGGKLVGQNFNANAVAEPKPTAGTDGTQLTVEDLFYNMPSRLKSLKSKNDEYSRILDVVGRYAIHCQNVGFSCKKFGESHQALSTRPHMSLKERIRIVQGSAIANDLIDLEPIQNKDHAESVGLTSVEGAITSSDYVNKKKVEPVLFINHRLVSCGPLKRSILAAYYFFLPKGNHPFIYLSLEIEPRNVDVNVHPTKREVRFLNEDEIIEIITDLVQSTLSSHDSARKIPTQTVLSKPRSQPTEPPTKKYRQENKLVRVDASQAKLSFLVPTSADSNSSKPDHIKTSERERSSLRLESITSLEEEVAQKVHKSLTRAITNASYIGIVDEYRRLCCFQYDVNLYLCDYAALLHELYYQIGLTEFANFGEYLLEPQLTMEQLLAPLYEKNADLVSKDKVTSTINDNQELLNDYFQIKVLDNRVISIPLIHQDIVPSSLKLPHFIYRLGTKVDYEDEKSCLQEILHQIALLYVPDAIPIADSADRGGSDARDTEAAENSTRRQSVDRVLEYVVFPLMKERFLVPNHLASSIIQIADLPGLYRVFERC
ncbi:DNA mismatch repair protein MLH1 [Meyerozyma sp. JA9]|nr:DNA mismatch repair protein MLH1 [Meyerozyma sp. JA9]